MNFFSFHTNFPRFRPAIGFREQQVDVSASRVSGISFNLNVRVFVRYVWDLQFRFVKVLPLHRLHENLVFFMF